MMQITWKRCHTYDEARDMHHCIYLHEWYGKPFYWGKVHNSFFGGHMRIHEGVRASGRYNVGYRHWIEGCLRHGASLYLGQLQFNDLYTIDEVETYLIHNFPSDMNKKSVDVSTSIMLEHTGDIPECLRSVMTE